MLDYIRSWLAGVQTKYNVNPLVFGAIYLISVPFFWISIYKIIAGLKNKKLSQVRTFAVILGFAIIAPFFYVAAFGRNLPVWFWAFTVVIIGYSVYSTLFRLRAGKKK
ncbi:MAG TPA: hypothetical protein VF399_07675 [bacterium]